MSDTGKTLDAWYGKIQKHITSKITNFVAFLFILVAIGAFLMMMVMQKYPEQAWMVVVAPIAAAIFAYYSRTFATIVFFGVLILIFLF